MKREAMQPPISKIRSSKIYLLIGVLLCVTFAMRSGKSEASGPGGDLLTDQVLPLQSSVTIQAAKRGNPWINLADGHEMQSSFKGSAKAMLASGAVRARSLGSADFNGDGFNDLIVGYAAGDGGSFALHRTNPEAIAPKLPENQEAVARLNF